MEDNIIVYFITIEGGKSGRVCVVNLHNTQPFTTAPGFPVMFHCQKLIEMKTGYSISLQTDSSCH